MRFSNGDYVKLTYNDKLTGKVVGRTSVQGNTLIIIELEDPIFYRDMEVSTSLVLVHPSNLFMMK